MNPTKLRNRNVHLDFHTSPLLTNIARDFDAKEFAATLTKAHVNSVTCFARCHHGMFYYPSQAHPELIHPGLGQRNLLGEQIDACHARGIKVPIYTTVQWDYQTAQNHPEWLTVDEHGTHFGETAERPQLPLNAGFYARLCVNTGYREFLKEHTRELLKTFDADGLFFDIVMPVPCVCPSCLNGMEKHGLNPALASDRQRFADQTIAGFQMEMSALVRSLNPKATIFYNQGHIGTPHRAMADSYTHFEIESLPSGIWGYLHFPVTMRYARNLGLECLAQTGKFHTMWGDFHSFKNQAALEFEVFQMLALGARCLIGDQLEPSGRLSGPVYDLIGSVYEQVEKKEPWVLGATPLTDIGVLTPEEFYGAGIGGLPPPLQGITRMLQESGHQFDILDSQSDFSRYRVVILPDNIPVSASLEKKLTAFVEAGGAVLASFESGLDEKKEQFVLQGLGITLNPNPARDPAGQLVRGQQFDKGDFTDYLLPRPVLAKGLPQTEHVMYTRGTEISASSGTEVLADAVGSYFDRTYQHFCSHRQTPSSGQVTHPAIVKNGRWIYFCHPVFTQYYRNAPRWCKQVFLNALELVLPQPLLRHAGPSTLLTAVTQQEAESRLVVHLIHYIPERRGVGMDIIEDVIPLFDIQLDLRLATPPRKVELAPEGTELPFTSQDRRVQFTVPAIRGHQMVEISY